MQIEAIYQDGRLEFTRPIHSKSGPVRLLIEVPPDALLAETAGAEAASAAHQVSEDRDRPRSDSVQPHRVRAPALSPDVAARLEQRRRVRAQILARPLMSESGPPPTAEQQSRDRAFSQLDQHDGS